MPSLEIYETLEDLPPDVLEAVIKGLKQMVDPVPVSPANYRSRQAEAEALYQAGRWSIVEMLEQIKRDKYGG
jgi:hypothetical protein